ncbi:ROK family protein [Williamsia deligens]|uniref:ROK family protein n=1 Tax=Williamsia deligens TaxID=321325 RepID=A0ABW3G634_9NOCA|nr:ROK family protein [Williamsia deligens]MCP2194949.1 glucokinase [Williamsia deligens]
MADPPDVAVAVDIGGTKVQAALVDSRGVVVEGTLTRAPTGRSASSDELDAAVLGVLAEVMASGAARTAVGGGHLVGIGVACAGPVDDVAGRVSPINLPAWRDHPLLQVISSAPVVGGIPVTLRRDGVAIALAEHWLGAGVGVASMMAMVVSTGIGGGILLGGRVVAGNAGHIGQIEVSGHVGEPSLGSRTTLESVASGPHTVAWARSQGFHGTTGEDLAVAVRAGDPTAAAAVDRLADVVAQGICSACALLDLDLVIIGGGFARVTDDLVARIGRRVATHPLPYVARTRVVPAQLGDAAPVVGAAAFVHRPDLLPG